MQDQDRTAPGNALKRRDFLGASLGALAGGVSAQPAMAQDMIEAMAKLGFDRFAIAGHDRGGRVVHRMALDHPDKVTKLVVMDILPSYYTFQHVDRRFATNNWYWFFLLEPSPFPETL